MLTLIFSGLISSASASKDICDRAEDAIREAKAREHFETIRLELDSALEPLLVEHGQLDALIASQQTVEARTVGARLVAQAQALIDRARQELSRIPS